MTKATFAVSVDWNNDGDFSDTGETVTSRVLNDPGIVVERGRDQVRALAPPMAGRAEFALNNASKDYSPANTGSPLYGNLLPGRAVRITADGSPFWRGTVDDLPQEPFVKGGGRVRVPALGTLAKLKGVRVSTELYTVVSTSAALAALFAAAGLAASEYTMLDAGKTALAPWWCAEDDAFAMMLRILAAEGPGAAIYEDAAGVITFHSRHYRLTTARSTTSQATFGNAATEPRHSPPFGYQPNLQGVVNAASLEVAALTFGAPATLLTVTFDTPVTLAPGASAAFDLALTLPSSGFSATATVTDFGSYSTAFSRTSGSRTTLTITSAATYTFTMTGLTLSGYAPTSSTWRVANTVDTSASRAKYGTRPLPSSYNPWPYIGATVAQDLCDAIVQAYQEPRATVALTVKNANATRLAQQLAREVSDRVTVQEAQTGFASAVYIEQIRHAVTAGGRVHSTTFGCEAIPAGYGDWFVFDTSVFDTGRFGF